MAIEKVNDSIQTVSEMTVGQIKKYKEQNPEKFAAKFGHIELDGLADDEVIVRERKWDGGATEARLKFEPITATMAPEQTETVEKVESVEVVEEVSETDEQSVETQEVTE